MREAGIDCVWLVCVTGARVLVTACAAHGPDEALVTACAAQGPDEVQYGVMLRNRHC